MIFKHHRSERAALLSQEISRLRKLFLEQGHKDVTLKKVIVFGSAGGGRIRGHSDIDLIIVQETNDRFIDRLEKIYRLIQPRIATDVLVYTPEEMDRMLRENTRFLVHALRQGEILYERNT